MGADSIFSVLVFLFLDAKYRGGNAIERLVRDEAVRILAVTEDAKHAAQYHIFLSDFPRADILG